MEWAWRSTPQGRDGSTKGPLDNRRIAWMVGIHLTFVVSGVLLALMD